MVYIIPRSRSKLIIIKIKTKTDLTIAKLRIKMNSQEGDEDPNWYTLGLDLAFKC